MAKEKSDCSIASLIRNLDEGETYSRTIRVQVGTSAAKSVTAKLGKLRNQVNQTVARLRVETGSNFRVESAAALTDDNAAMLVTVAVTNMEPVAADI